MKLYLDNCCFNRPYDDQSDLRIRLEAEAKLRIQEEVREKSFQLVWSYILDYENSKNPFLERKEQICKWKSYAIEDINETVELVDLADMFQKQGIKAIDALHLACAVSAKVDYFLTTDDGILKKSSCVQDIRVADPIAFIKEVLI